jgi:homoserine dehydrogenase
VLVREGKAREPFHVTSLDDILSDPSVEAVAEVMGGIEPAFSYAKRVLESGRHLVTANKALCAAHGEQ